MLGNARGAGRKYPFSLYRGQGGNIMRCLLKFSLIIAAVTIASCATVPTGPSVMALPGSGKSFEQFRVDDASCRQYAYEQVGGVSGQQAAQRSAVSSVAVGTAVGAAAGAAIGSASGNMGAGVAIGVGTGLLFGSAAGTGYASGSYYAEQRRYDNAYLQCMYAKGNQIPGYRRQGGTPPYSSHRWASPPPPADYPPPPSDNGY
jgi:Glycine-zipper domain